MDLNLVALATLAVALAAGGALLRRYLRRSSTGLEIVCLRCGTPARALASFTCPGCGHDVREAGLGAPRGASPLRTYWAAVGYTFVFLFASVILASVVVAALPRVQGHAAYRYTRVTSPQVHAIDLFFESHGSGAAGSAGPPSSLPGTLSGDLYATGGLVTLELRVPDQRWRLLDIAGRELDAGDGYDAQTLYRWLERGGVDMTSPVAQSDAAHIARKVYELTRLNIEMPPVPARALSLSYSSSGGGYSSSRADERGLPLVVAVLAVTWVGGLWLVLGAAAKTGARSRPPAPPPIAAAGKGEGESP